MRIRPPHLYKLVPHIISQIIFICILLPGPNRAQSSNSNTVSNLVEQSIRSSKPEREMAAATLARMGDGARGGVRQLIEALKDPDNAIRLNANDALVKLGLNAPEVVVPELTEALKNPDRGVRAFAALTLGIIGKGAEGAVAQLAEALKDTDAGVRRSAAEALGKIGGSAKVAEPQLLEALKDPDLGARSSAAGALGILTRSSGPSGRTAHRLVEMLKDPDKDVRLTAMSTLGIMGPWVREAVPHLLQAMKDPDKDIRMSAARTLGFMQELGQEAVPQLIEALKDPDKDIRSSAASALWDMREWGAGAVPQLTEALKDPDVGVRSNAADALGNIGSKAKRAVPQLTEALKDPDENVQRSAAVALAQLSTIIAKEKATEFSKDLETAAGIMRDSKNPMVEVNADRVQQASDLLKLLWWEQLKQWVAANPYISLAAAALPSLILACFVVLWLRPLWLLHINEFLAKATDAKLPEKFGGFNVAPRYLILVGFFHYHPRVLDAWVAKHIDSARKMFSGLPTVEERKIYVPLPVVLGDESEADLSPGKVRLVLSGKLFCLQIWGEGGSGKTSLACRLAHWAMAPEKEARLKAEHLMLPVLVEQDLIISDKDLEYPLLKAIRQQVRVMISEEEAPPVGLLRQLLKKRRVLVIVDGFSEMSEQSRAAALSGITDLPANAVIVTTRTDEQLGAIPKTEIKPLRVQGNRLSTFMEAYLTARKKRELFEDDEFFEACRRLSLIVGDRDITALLAKLYAEQMIAAKEGAPDADAPENIPELMLSYLNDISRKAGPGVPDIRVVHRAAKYVAWECLKKTLRPTPAPRDDVLLALSREGDGEGLLKHLEERLKVIQTVGAGRDRIRFALDPLAEYLAGMHLVDLYGEDEQAWRSFLALADEQGGEPEDIKGFLLAVRDCCLAIREDVQVLRSVADELGMRAGLSPEESNQYRVRRRVKQLVSRLKYSEVKDRVNAAEELGEIGAPAKVAVEDLCTLLRDHDESVRRAAASALGEIGEGAKEAVPQLAEALKDPDESVRSAAANALIDIGERGREAVPQLIGALDDPDETVRALAAIALGNHGQWAREAVPQLIKGLKDSHNPVRRNSAEALGRVAKGEKETVVPHLIEVLNDPQEHIREVAAIALRELGEEARESKT